MFRGWLTDFARQWGSFLATPDSFSGQPGGWSCWVRGGAAAELFGRPAPGAPVTIT